MASKQLRGRVVITLRDTNEQIALYSNQSAPLYQFTVIRGAGRGMKFGDWVRQFGYEAELNGTPKYDIG